jgi:hypothetical protein
MDNLFIIHKGPKFMGESYCSRKFREWIDVKTCLPFDRPHGSLMSRLAYPLMIGLMVHSNEVWPLNPLKNEGILRTFQK